jgi:hypothetical protein
LGSSTGHSPVDYSAPKSLVEKLPTKTATLPLVPTRPLQKDINIMRIRILVSPQQRLARVADMKNAHDVVLNNVENAIYAFSATEQELAD